MLAASANVLGTEGHRSQIRLRGHELAGTTARPICSSRPTWQSHERPCFCSCSSRTSQARLRASPNLGWGLDEPTLPQGPPVAVMRRALASDPVLQARFFHEMTRLFFEELLNTLPPMARASYHVGVARSFEDGFAVHVSWLTTWLPFARPWRPKAGDRCTLTSSACFWGTTWAHDSAAFNRVLPSPAIENAKPFAVEAFCHFKSCHLFSACWSAAC